MQRRRKRPILVYTMGKVGSSSVATALAASQTDSIVYHVHWLTNERLERDAELYERRSLFPQYIEEGNYIMRRLDRARASGDSEVWTVITLVRDPIARNVSSFFQSLPLLGYSYEEQVAKKSQSQILEDLLEMFHREYVLNTSGEMLDGDPLTWFDEELQPVFGVDVYRREFPISKGYDIYETDRVRILLLRVEDLNRCAAEAIDQFLGIRNFSVGRNNVSTKKRHGSLYSSFRAALTLPASYINRQYDSRYAQHFYNPQEISSFRKRWSLQDEGESD